MRHKDIEKRGAHLIGVGLDNKDGHARITQSEQFSLLGGSEETHENMTETVVKTMENLKQKGQSLEETNPRELSDLLDENRPE